MNSSKKYILDGMPSLLGQMPFPYFQNNWPQNRDLPPLVENQSVTLNEENFNLLSLNQKSDKSENSAGFQPRIQMRITRCEHVDSKHYARNMCSACYHKNRKSKKIPQCGHTDRIVFARNMCCSCYTNAYKAFKKESQDFQL